MREDRLSVIKAVGIGSTVSASLAGLVIGGYFFGRYIGDLLDWHPWAEILFILLGLGAGIAYIISALIRWGKRT